MRKENWVCSTFRDIFVDASDYQYDLQNRLTEINIQGLPVFGKDLLKQTIQMEYDERGNLIKTTSGNSVLSQYTFDTANRLSETTNVLGIKTNFIYDGAGRRVKMQIDLPKPNIRSIFKPGLGGMFNTKNQANEKETCSWLYNGKDYKLEYNYALDITEPYENVLMIYGKGIDTQRYTYGLDVLSLDTWNKSVSTWSQNSVNGITSKKTDRGYYLQDELGSPVRIVGEAGNTKAIYSYDAFGRPIIPVNLISQCKTRGNIYSYTGYQYDLSTGLMYAQARYYMPEVGRFISEDAYKGTVAEPQSLNWYVYCRNNPILYIDPSGNVTIVFNYVNPDNPDSSFTDQANNSAYFNATRKGVKMIAVTSVQDFVDAWNDLDDSDIDDVYLLLYGGEGDLYFKGETLSFSCHGGQGEEGNNVAWMFAKKTGAAVRASTGGVSYSKLFGKYHARMEERNFWNVFVVEWYTYYYEKRNIFWGDIVAKSKPYSSRWAI